MSTITEEELKELEELEEKATPSEWYLSEDEINSEHFRVYTDSNFKGVCRPTHPNPWHHKPDMEFICKSRNLLPRLLQAYREQREEIQKQEIKFELLKASNQLFEGVANNRELQLSEKDREIEAYKAELGGYEAEIVELKAKLLYIAMQGGCLK